MFWRGIWLGWLARAFLVALALPLRLFLFNLRFWNGDDGSKGAVKVLELVGSVALGDYLRTERDRSRLRCWLHSLLMIIYLRPQRA